MIFQMMVRCLKTRKAIASPAFVIFNIRSIVPMLKKSEKILLESEKEHFEISKILYLCFWYKIFVSKKYQASFWKKKQLFLFFPGEKCRRYKGLLLSTDVLFTLCLICIYFFWEGCLAHFIGIFVKFKK